MHRQGDQARQHVRQLRRVAVDRRQMCRVLSHDRNRPVADKPGNVVDGLFDDSRQIHRFRSAASQSGLHVRTQAAPGPANVGGGARVGRSGRGPERPDAGQFPALPDTPTLAYPAKTITLPSAYRSRSTTCHACNGTVLYHRSLRLERPPRLSRPGVPVHPHFPCSGRGIRHSQLRVVECRSWKLRWPSPRWPSMPRP
jgi:hypothetical protein